MLGAGANNWRVLDSDQEIIQLSPNWVHHPIFSRGQSCVVFVVAMGCYLIHPDFSGDPEERRRNHPLFSPVPQKAFPTQGRCIYTKVGTGGSIGKS